MVTQLSASMDRKFGVIEQFIDTIGIDKLANQELSLEEQLVLLRDSLNVQIENFDVVDRQAVQQSSMDEGDIELF